MVLINTTKKSIKNDLKKKHCQTLDFIFSFFVLEERQCQRSSIWWCFKRKKISEKTFEKVSKEITKKKYWCFLLGK